MPEINYSPLQWLLFFYIYCFFGWIIESAYVSVCTAEFVNRGFLKGPMIPIYGFGAVGVLVATLPFRAFPILVFVMGIIAATLLELVTGWLMEMIFKMRYWDYSKRKFNFHGYICLFNSVCWGFLSIAMVYAVHTPLEALVLKIGYIGLVAVDSGISSLFIADIVTSGAAAIQLRELLINSDKLRGELLALHNTVNEWNDKLESNKKRVVELKESMTNKEMFSTLRNYFAGIKDNNGNGIPDGLEEAFEGVSARYRRTMYELDRRKTSLLRGNPTAVSKRFGSVLNEIKENIAQYKNK